MMRTVIIRLAGVSSSSSISTTVECMTNIGQVGSRVILIIDRAVLVDF